MDGESQCRGDVENIMSDLVEKLLQPVSAEQPCGPDLSYDPRFDELEKVLKGKPEIEIGNEKRPAEPPDWKILKTHATEFLGAAKHLRPAVILTCALVQTDGLPGLCDGLRVIRGLLEKFWGNLHPLLDPEDNNDPQQRLNIISGLTSPRNPGGDIAGWLQIIDCLHQVPICRPRGVPPISLDTLAAAQAPVPIRTEEGAPAATGTGLAAVETQIRSADPAQLTANHVAVKEALEAAEGIDQFLSATLGSGGSISFEELTGALKQMERTIAAYLPGAQPNSSTDGGAGDAGSGGGGALISGSIRSRDDVVRMLEKICDYYRQVEPGSPVPYLLKRAQKLAVMNFVDAMQELNLAGPDQLRPSMGSAVEGSAGGLPSE